MNTCFCKTCKFPLILYPDPEKNGDIIFCPVCFTRSKATGKEEQRKLEQECRQRQMVLE